MKKIKIAGLSILGILLGLLLLVMWVNIYPKMFGKFDFCDNNQGINYIRNKAEDSRNNGDYLKATGELLRFGWTKSDCRLRVAISKPFFERATELENQGRLKEAIDTCIIGAHTVIGQYDTKGGFMDQCDELSIKYYILSSKNLTPLVTPTIEP